MHIVARALEPKARQRFVVPAHHEIVESLWRLVFPDILHTRSFKFWTGFTGLTELFFKQVGQEMQENNWGLTPAPHTSVSPVLHAKIPSILV